MKKWTDVYGPADLILYQDDHLLVCNKPPGVPAQPDKSGDFSMQTWLEQYLQKSIHLLSRLDRPVSGAMACSLKDHGASPDLKKAYLAITSPPKEPEARLIHHLEKDGRHHKTRIVEEGSGKQAVLSYTTLQVLDRYHVLEVKTESGRFHQIRAQLSDIGCPIKGDVKYGARRGNPDRSIDLHAHQIEVAELLITAPWLGRSGIWEHVKLDQETI